MSGARDVAVVCGFAVAGCGLFPSFDGFSTDYGRDASPDDARAEAGDAGDAGDAGPVPCAKASAVFCEDFEDGISASVWQQVVQENATATADSTRPHRGARSLRAHGNAIGATANVGALVKHYGALPSPAFVRFFAYVPSAPPAGVVSILGVQRDADPYPGVQLDITDGAALVTDYSNPPGFALHGASFPTDRWVCVEEELTAGSPGAVSTWLDGVAVPALSSSSVGVPGLGILTFGQGAYPADPRPAYDVWIDDIYVDAARVGCDK